MATAKLPDYNRRNRSALEGRTVEELLAMRAEIDEELGDLTLKSVSIEKELVIQLLAAQALQKDTLSDENTPANQKAQVLNAAGAALANLAKLQTEIYDSERLKKIEAILIECVQELPMDTQEQFFQMYEQRLGKMGD